MLRSFSCVVWPGVCMRTHSQHAHNNRVHQDPPHEKPIGRLSAWETQIQPFLCCTVFSLGTHIITEVTHGGHICRGHNRAKQFRCLSILKAMLTTLYCIHGVLDWVSVTVIKHCEQKQVGEKSIYFNSSQLAAHHPGSQERD